MFVLFLRFLNPTIQMGFGIWSIEVSCSLLELTNTWLTEDSVFAVFTIGTLAGMV